MIISKKLKKNIFIEKILNFLKILVYFVGTFTLILLILSIIYYYQSGFKQSNPPSILFKKINEKILIKYLGYDFFKFNDYIRISFINFLGQFQSSDLEKIFIEINQKSIFGLEMQRKIRKENNGEIPSYLMNTYPAKIKFDDNYYKVKIRTKGVRNIHWSNKDTTSYKIDLIGENRIWGLEEFSVQKPITRNYTYEYLFHELLGHVGLTRIKYFFVNLFLNDQNLGVYAVEESFSKELVERQQLRNGPIFGVSEELGEYYPNIKYELYSEKYWIDNYPWMITNLYSILNDIKNGERHINNHFDINQWAKYFAIIDLTGAYHGSLSKSVKNYYNPTTALFEPIGYDLHKGAGNFENFILLDFLQETKPNCIYLCDHKNWYLKFFLDENNRINYTFIDQYINYLKKYSDAKFIKKFLNSQKKKIKKYNKEIYKDNSKVDKITRVGLGYFIYDPNYLIERSELIRNRINSSNIEGISISLENNILRYEDYDNSNFPLKAKSFECNSITEEENFYFSGKMEIEFKTSCSKMIIEDNKNNSKIFNLEENISMSAKKKINFKSSFKKLTNYNFVKKISNKSFLVEDDLIIDENTIFEKDFEILIKKGNKINILNNSTLIIEGNINFENNLDNPSLIFSEDGTGSLIFYNNNYELKNIIFKNLSSPKLDNYILYGGINFINTNLNLENIIVSNSKNEDGMNIINSNSNLYNLKFENIFADALDIDFGNALFNNIECNNVKNDCLDISGSNIIGKSLITKNTTDKGVSVGEKSYINVENLYFINNKVAIAVKDGSTAEFRNVVLKNNNYDIAIFNKKNEFEKPSLIINKVKDINKKKILQSKDTFLKIDDNIYFGNNTDTKINSLIYSSE